MERQKVLVIGLGRSGSATARYLLQEGYDVVGVDAQWESEAVRRWQHTVSDARLIIQSDAEPQNMASYAFAVISPGISQKHPLYAKALECNLPIFSEAQLILKDMKQRCIGITGTNGKTTLTLFLEHLFHTAHIPARAIGNVGYPFCQYRLEHPDAVEETLVCELSSYQLETLSAPMLDIGILLEITPDHLDRYPSVEAYASAKLRIARCIKSTAQGRGGILFVHHAVAIQFKKELELCEGRIIVIPKLFSNPDKDSYLQLKTNREYCAFLDLVKEKVITLQILYLGKAIAAQFSIQDADLARAIATFVKPHHRLEPLAVIRGVRFINDSKATNVESVIHAVGTIEGGLLLIAGGKDKNLRFEQWKKPFANRVRKIFVIGECAAKIQKVMEDEYDVELCRDLEDATRKAFMIAKEQESVLLSPGCASFDSYKDYMHRGECFREIVIALNEEFSE